MTWVFCAGCGDAWILPPNSNPTLRYENRTYSALDGRVRCAGVGRDSGRDRGFFTGPEARTGLRIPQFDAVNR